MNRILNLVASFLRGRRQSQAATAPDAVTTSPEPASKDLPEKVTDFVLKRWDAGVFGQELVNVGVAPVAPTKQDPRLRVNDGQIQEGTYGGTQLALTEMYDRIERA